MVTSSASQRFSQKRDENKVSNAYLCMPIPKAGPKQNPGAEARAPPMVCGWE